MLRIFARGPDTYLLLAEDHGIVGWIRGRVLRFTGFESRAAAAAAAVGGGRALAAYTSGAALPTGPAVARPPSTDVGSSTRLVPPRRADAIPVIDDVHASGSECTSGLTYGMDTYSIEFMLAEGLHAGACGTIAQVVYAALSHDRREPARHRPTPAA
jgi:hypothetical protein